MKITIECRSRELFKLGKGILLELRQQHEEDVRSGESIDHLVKTLEIMQLKEAMAAGLLQDEPQETPS